MVNTGSRTVETGGMYDYRCKYPKKRYLRKKEQEQDLGVEVTLKK